MFSLISLLFSASIQAQEAKTEAGESKNAGKMEWVRVSDDKRGFVLEKSGGAFVPWGFNYDHDEDGRLIEDYWDAEWPKVEADFREMKQLGANVVRIHLQTAKFMETAERPNEANLKQFSRLLDLAERVQLRLDVTGLGCYHKKDVPDWYDALDEKGRWAVQARFWEAIAACGANSPAVFFYDLMNEPVVPGGNRQPKDWLGPPFAGKHFVQCITLSQGDRPRPEIAKKWIAELAAAIRKHDRRHLITVGLVDWSLDRPGLTSGFVPEKIIDEMDFVCVHLYPEKGKGQAALDTLAGFAVGKPIVIEETFPLNCPLPEFEKFLDDSRNHAAGWIGFYWGKTPEECRRGNTIADAITLAWLELFQKKSKEFTDGK
ncbi:MAG: cellulase family glycosylhydrolase [Pirellulales bacterium]|nr:cellulase family glycosylhydrolase [Pirellulales bacterium]